MRLLRLLGVLACLAILVVEAGPNAERQTEQFFKRGKSQSKHTNNWAVIVDTSIFWFNYRHASNALSIYHTVKRLGIPDSNIILMLGDDAACNTRNPRPGTIYNNQDHHVNLYDEDVQVDYRGYEVDVTSFIRVLTGRHASQVPRSKRLLTNQGSNILVYMTGHGGNGYLKFLDFEEIHSRDLADAFGQMWEQQRYNEILFIVDTCQAESLPLSFYSPNIIALTSSNIGENSWAHHTDTDVGVAVIDKFTYYALDFLERVQPGSDAVLPQIMFPLSYDKLGSTANGRFDLFRRDVNKVLITDFFGSECVIKNSSLAHDLSSYQHADGLTTATPIQNDATRSSVVADDMDKSADGADVVVSVTDDIVVARRRWHASAEFVLALSVILACVVASSLVDFR